MSEAQGYHVPVMLAECLESLQLQPGETAVDLTFGGGGHSKAMLQALGGSGRLFAFDKDPDAAANAQGWPGNFCLIAADFRFMKQYLALHGVSQVQAILADLGVSSHQFDQGHRGFSLRYDGPLDMRMNPQAGTSAAQLLKELDTNQLQQLFSTYGEVRNARTLAQAIHQWRSNQALETTGQLAQLLRGLAPRGKEHKYLAQVFQALRIAVNDEMAGLEEMLQQCAQVLAPGGRLVLLTYHSLEDRRVKNFLKAGNMEGQMVTDLYGHVQRPFQPMHRQALVPSAQEMVANSRARSAKLRAGLRLPL